ncbi:MAG: methyltransferase [Myxococcota bacterium]
MRFRSEPDLRDARRTWRGVHVLAAARAAGLLDALDEEVGRTAASIAERADADPRVTRVCLDVLAASGLLRWDPSGYRLAPGARATLAGFDEMAHEIDAIRALPGALRTGAPYVRTVGGVDLEDADDRRRFYAGLRRRALASVPEVTRVVRRAWESQGIRDRAPRLLDLGGGHGLFAATFAAAFPGAEVSLFDQPLAAEHARALSGDGFRLLTGDWYTDDLGGPYDVVFVSNVLHGEDASDAARLLARVRGAVRDGGAVVVRDRFVHDDHTGPDWATDFAITLVLYTDKGHTRTVAEARALLRAAGFGDGEHHAAASDEYAYLVARTA